MSVEPVKINGAAKNNAFCTSKSRCSTFVYHHMLCLRSVFPTKITYSPCALVGVRNTREWVNRQRDPHRPTFFLSASPEQVDLRGAGLTGKGMMNALLDQFTSKGQEDQT